jgi:hypothetical protein
MRLLEKSVAWCCILSDNAFLCEGEVFPTAVAAAAVCFGVMTALGEVQAMIGVVLLLWRRCCLFLLVLSDPLLQPTEGCAVMKSAAGCHLILVSPSPLAQHTVPIIVWV